MHSMVGLRNVGNTCYFNSLAQIYNMLPPIRDLVFSLPWQESEPYKDKCTLLSPLLFCFCFFIFLLHGTGLMVRVVIRELQRLFALLSLSDRKYVDPTPVITALLAGTGQKSKIGSQEDPTGTRRVLWSICIWSSSAPDLCSEFNLLFLKMMKRGIRHLSKEEDSSAVNALKRFFFVSR